MPKNTLTVRLTEGALFLHTSQNNARRRNPAHDFPDTRPSMLRGLLTLTIVKPIKITSIDLELQAKSSTCWPEGIGARRVDVQEEHKIFSESIVFFRAGLAPRRRASVGPGVDPSLDDDWYDHSPRSDEQQLPRSARAARRVSADSSYFHTTESDEHAPPIPPYTPTPPSSHTSPAQSSAYLTSVGENPAHALEDFRNTLRAGLSPARTATGDRSPGGMRSSSSSFRDLDATVSRRPSIDTLAEVDEDRRDAAPGSSSPKGDSRGRRARFSLTSVSSVLLDAVRSGTSKTRSSRERDDPYRRGRTGQKAAPSEGEYSAKERPPLGRDKEKLDSWKEFKKGTYTFPISFAVPQDSPPSMECPWGRLVWRLKANVHRPGAFAPRMTAVREVVVVAGPMEDDTEDTENIVVERHWEQQLQYLISISGRSFAIGGVVPVTFTMMPIAKVRIHRLSIYLEEKVEYYSQMRQVARTDPILRIPLLSIKHDDRKGEHILPLDSNDTDALTTSPLLGLTMPGDDLSELASEWMGPGPWTFHQELQLPPSCTMLRFTNKNKRSNMCVTHVLKCSIRIERGDDVAMDPKTGKRKLFDIVVQTPVHILSCRCNPEWMSLPQYSTSFEDPTSVAPNCPCDVQINGPLERMLSRQSTDSSASAAETSPVHATMSLRTHDTLLARNVLFERLMAGQESEVGEAPPAYGT
ncbi:hypothetical protein DFH07DRAFT_953375 [Mycena maculata]|uniref:Arrestin C-terminal-like domain-containing protein n=1 Tax=Mycena maculata TaxID=230809 RepID=A0AAD7NRP1_9AGAR|nr:hypothetical protein DFH07DRAFT_953375 [Mycena maculata]